MKLMNSGTKIRTICLIIVMINQANVTLGQMDFGNETVNLIYRVGSYLLTLIAAIAAWYYNNDTTEEGAIGTGITRQLKREKEEGYIGDFFYTDEYIQEYEEVDDQDRGSENIEDGEDNE